MNVLIRPGVSWKVVIDADLPKRGECQIADKRIGWQIGIRP